MSLHFDELFRKKLQKVPHFVKKHEKPSIWPKLAIFRGNYDVLAFSWTFQKEVAKSASFREKARKTMDLAKTLNFSRKLRCLGIFMNFSERSCKKCLISWNSTKNHWFGQNFATFGTSYNVFFLLMNFQEKSCKKCVVSWKSTKNHRFCQLANFRENYHVLTFRWTLQQKVAKSCSCREKARKVINLAKSLQLFEQTSMFLHFDEFSRKKLPKVLPFVKKLESSSIWPKLCNFSSKLPCFGMPHFVKKHEKSSIWRKLATFPANYHVLTLWWTFQRKVAESASFSEKTLKIIDWAKTCNFFEQSTMFTRFDELFSKRLQKVPRFVKKHEHSSIWPKLATFRTNYHVLAFRWTFQEKNAKSGPFREKARTLIDLAKTCNFSKKLPCFGISMIIAGKSCKKVEKVAHLVKNDEKSSIWPKLATFRGNYHVSAFLSTFQQKVSHFAKKHEKSSFGSCLAHS